MADIDVKYLREKNVPVLLESLAAEIVTQKPANPELFLREKFALGEDGVVQRGDSVRLHGTTLDVYTSVALLAAAFIKAPVELVEVNSASPSPTFSQLNPFGSVPVLEAAGSVLCEAGPVARALCYRTTALPLSAREFARIDSAFDTIMVNVVASVARVVEEGIFMPRRLGRPVDSLNLAALVEAATMRLQQLCANPAFFRDSQWVVGSSVSIADFALAGAVFAMQHTAGVNCVNGLEKLQRWWAAVQREEFFVEGTRGFTAAALKLHA